MRKIEKNKNETLEEFINNISAKDKYIECLDGFMKYIIILLRIALPKTFCLLL